MSKSPEVVQKAMSIGEALLDHVEKHFQPMSVEAFVHDTGFFEAGGKASKLLRPACGVG